MYTIAITKKCLFYDWFGCFNASEQYTILVGYTMAMWQQVAKYQEINQLSCSREVEANEKLEEKNTPKGEAPKSCCFLEFFNTSA